MTEPRRPARGLAEANLAGSVTTFPMLVTIETLPTDQT